MSITHPKVSVCIVTYNQQKYIEDCLLSVLTQRCEAVLEILVGDDCSTDATGTIIKKVAAQYPGQLHVPIREKNLGPTGNYQDLIARATGDYIAHLDGDDYWMPEKTAAQLDFMRANPDCAAVYTNAIVVDEGGREIGVFNNGQPETFDRNYLLRGGNFLNHSSLLYRSKYRDAILGIDREFIDYQMHIRLSAYGALGYVNSLLVVYRKDSSTSMLRNSGEKVEYLYWQALLDAETDRATRSHGMATFFATIISRKVAHLHFRQAMKWGKLIGKEAGQSALHVFAIGTFDIFVRSLKRLACTARLRKSSHYPILHKR